MFLNIKLHSKSYYYLYISEYYKQNSNENTQTYQVELVILIENRIIETDLRDV